MLEMERGDASKFMQRTLFDLPHTLSADAEDRGDLLGRVLAFVRDRQSAVSRRPQPMLAIATMLKVVATLSAAADGILALVGAFAH